MRWACTPGWCAQFPASIPRNVSSPRTRPITRLPLSTLAPWTIPPPRTRQTLAAVAAAGLPHPQPLVEPAFIEQSFGDWQGSGWAELQARDPEALAAFWKDPTGNAPPGGESFAAQIARVGAAIDRLSTQFEGRDIACFSHGGTIRAACAHALGLPAPAAMALVVDNLSLTCLDRLAAGMLRGMGGIWRVRCVNAPACWIPRKTLC